MWERSIHSHRAHGHAQRLEVRPDDIRVAHHHDLQRVRVQVPLRRAQYRARVRRLQERGLMVWV